MKKILITGGHGQDGHYLRKFLLELDPTAKVFPIGSQDKNIATDIWQIKPDECYHLAAFHRSSQAGTDRDAVSSEKRYLADLNFTHDLLSALREYSPACKVFLAGSCHQFGPVVNDYALREETPMRPNTMYGITKLAMMQMGQYFLGQGLFCVTGILFNHESPRRGPSFVTSRLARAAARGERVEVGDLDARVDWGFAGDYVKAMVAMVRSEVPNSYVISSGELHKVRDFAKIAFQHRDLDYRNFVTEEPTMHKPVTRGYFGDNSAIRRQLGWAPTTSFRDLVRMMVDSHL